MGHKRPSKDLEAKFNAAYVAVFKLEQTIGELLSALDIDLESVKDEQVTRVTGAWRTQNLFMTLILSPADRKAMDYARSRLREVFFKSASKLKYFLEKSRKLGLKVRGFHPIKKRGLDWVRTQHPVSAIVDFSSVQEYVNRGKVEP